RPSSPTPLGGSDGLRIWHASDGRCWVSFAALSFRQASMRVPKTGLAGGGEGGEGGGCWCGAAPLFSALTVTATIVDKDDSIRGVFPAALPSAGQGSESRRHTSGEQPQGFAQTVRVRTRSSAMTWKICSMLALLRLSLTPDASLPKPCERLTSL
ncbi:hypothetical protein GGP41_009105, partial [Bipolaris sorokiniana]